MKSRNIYRNLIVASLLVFLLVGNAFAQFRDGDRIVSAYFGLASVYKTGFPMGLCYEVGIRENLSVGGMFDYQTGSDTGNQFVSFFVGAKGAYHFNNLLDLPTDRLDIYAGAGLGYRYFNWRTTFVGTSLGNPYQSAFGLMVYIGGRYYFTRSFGAVIEAGRLGLTYVNVGLSLKF